MSHQADAPHAGSSIILAASTGCAIRQDTLVLCTRGQGAQCTATRALRCFYRVSRPRSQVAGAGEDDAHSMQAASSACSTPTFSLDEQPAFTAIYEEERAPDPAGARPCQTQQMAPRHALCPTKSTPSPHD